jgi:hypothetical protein
MKLAQLQALERQMYTALLSTNAAERNRSWRYI